MSTEALADMSPTEIGSPDGLISPLLLDRNDVDSQGSTVGGDFLGGEA